MSAQATGDHDDHGSSSTPSSSGGGQKMNPMILYIVGGIILLLMLLKGCGVVGEKKEKDTDKKVSAAASQILPPRTLLQLPTCFTPCSVQANEITAIYTDGKPILVQPPRETEKVPYSTGSFVLPPHMTEGDNKHSGTWRFYSTTSEVVEVRSVGR